MGRRLHTEDSRQQKEGSRCKAQGARQKKRQHDTLNQPKALSEVEGSTVISDHQKQKA
jgi:hypothetical protein